MVFSKKVFRGITGNGGDKIKVTVGNGGNGGEYTEVTVGRQNNVGNRGDPGGNSGDPSRRGNGNRGDYQLSPGNVCNSGDQVSDPEF